MASDQLLEQYKLYVELADRVSDRRIKTNQYFITLLSGLLVVLSFVLHKDQQATLSRYQPYIVFSVGLLGIILCLVWQLNISSYRQLNSQKFQVIHDMEKHLPYPLFAKEWQLLGEGKDRKKYLQLSRVEKLVPVILSLPFVVLFIYALF
ncbi:hypothetical protein AB9P05_00435 [Roseivirga sp. BDSF3-8]|uniref:RipA family octameric membrane protein n=1 Tax=Roseivirga sp. BDSF3-8 TaxID=3241598 RepID=UPI00353205F1